MGLLPGRMAIARPTPILPADIPDSRKKGPFSRWAAPTVNVGSRHTWHGVLTERSADAPEEGFDAHRDVATVDVDADDVSRVRHDADFDVGGAEALRESLRIGDGAHPIEPSVDDQ